MDWIFTAIVQAVVAPIVTYFHLLAAYRGVKLSKSQWAYTIGYLVVFGVTALTFLENYKWVPAAINYFLASLIIMGPLAHFLDVELRSPKQVKAALRGAQLNDGSDVAAHQNHMNVDFSNNIRWGGVAVDYDREAEHFLITGKTGAGKTQAINEMLRVARKRRNSAVIADPGGGYLARFHQDSDYILNPFDSRSVAWSPFLEIRKPYDCPRIAKAAIPDASGNGKEWSHYAQTLFSELLKHQWQAGNHSVKELLRLATSARPAELDKLLRDTPAGAYTALDNERMLGSIRSTMASHIGAWEYLPDNGNFSVREWTKRAGEGNGEGWLYLTYMDNQLAFLRSLVSCWLEITIVEGLSLPENSNRRLFYVMDELDSLGKVTSLRAGLTKLRKYGGVCVNGLQTIAQLRDTYGKEEAQTLLSCMSTKLLLAAGDGETAEYFSREIGDQEFARTNISESSNTGKEDFFQTGGTVGQSVSIEHRTERLILPSEITSLPNLHGFLKPVGAPVNRIVLEYIGMPDLVPPFVED